MYVLWTWYDSPLNYLLSGTCKKNIFNYGSQQHKVWEWLSNIEKKLDELKDMIILYAGIEFIISQIVDK